MPGFEDLLAANHRFAADTHREELDGVARAGIAVVTCMDSRIAPLSMIGLEVGDAKLLRNPGGRVDARTLEGLVLAVHLLGVTRIMVVPHTRCAVASKSEAELRALVEESAGVGDTGWQPIHAVRDQLDSLADDVQKIRTHALIPATTEVGGFVYDVDTGLLEQKF